MQYKLNKENHSFIKEAITTGNLKEYLEELTSQIEKKENELLTSISKDYLTLINLCQDLNNFIIPDELDKNLPKLREIGKKLVYTVNTEKENAFCLERVQILISETDSLLKIIRFLRSKSDLLTETKESEKINKFLTNFYKYNFYNELESIYKEKVILLNKRCKEEAADWVQFLKRNTSIIYNSIPFKKSNSVIFNDFYSIKPLFDLERIYNIIYSSNNLNININFLYEYLHSFSNEEELLVYASALIFLSEKSEIDKFINFDKINNLIQIKKLIQFYSILEEDTSLLESKHKELSILYLEEKKDLLEKDINLFLKEVNIDYTDELAEYIDTFICNKFIEGKKVEITNLLKDPRFINYEWNWKIMLFRERIQRTKEKINNLLFRNTNELINSLDDCDNQILNELEEYFFDKFHSEFNKGNKNELIKDAIIIVKYYEDRKCRNNRLKELIS